MLYPKGILYPLYLKGILHPKGILLSFISLRNIPSQGKAMAPLYPKGILYPHGTLHVPYPMGNPLDILRGYHILYIYPEGILYPLYLRM